MKTKKYLYIIVRHADGKTHKNPLKLSEAYLISKIAQDYANATIIIELATATTEQYKYIFG
jgi:hypothetical protein